MSWNELSLKDKADYIKESVNNGIYNLSDIRNRYNMYAEGGYKPSESIKKRITNWEGSSMRTNRSFQAEANDFNKVIPSSIRSKLSQQQLDALYSYGYNVGMGNLKKRVLPILTNYVQGKASNEDVQKSMWASKDNELRGLTTRRNIERSLFGGNYQTVFTGTGGTPHNYGYIANRSNSNPYQIQNEEWQGKNYLNAYKGLQLSMNDIMGKTKETDIDDLFSTGTGLTISMENLLSIGNNNVAPVQPDYSYAKSLLSDFDSDLNSNIFGNGGKIPRTYQGDLNHLKDVDYQKWRANLPTNLREETSDYNLYEAYKSGAKPRLESDGYYHLPSRDPRTNKILKKPTHPTYGMALREDAIEGYLPIYKNNETYTYPLPWIKADGGKLNIFAEGDNLNFIDADNRRSNILLHVEDGNLYDSAGNNYTQSYLDEEHVPIIKGTMPRNTRQYYDPNTTLEFINAATAPISNFSPSNIVGSIREARDYNTFMNSFMNQDNTGFFTREYTKEHPYISTLGNIGGDILLPNIGGKTAISIYRLRPNNLRKHIFENISPIGYDKPISRIKEAFKSALSGAEAYIDNPSWFNDKSAQDLNTYNIGITKNMFGPHALEARFDAWRKYLGLPQKFNTWTESPIVKGAYTDTKGISNLKVLPKNQSVDFINSAGGNVANTIEEFATRGYNGQKYGVSHIRDTWDLQPWSRLYGNIIEDKVIRPLYNNTIGKVNRKLSSSLNKFINKYGYDNEAIQKYLNEGGEEALDNLSEVIEDFADIESIKGKLAHKLSVLSDVLTDKSYYIINEDSKLSKLTNKLSNKIKNFEASSLLPGAKPFKIAYDIPWTNKVFPNNKMIKGFDLLDTLPTEVHRYKLQFPKLDYTLGI